MKTKQLMLEGLHSIFWRVRIGKARKKIEKNPTIAMIEGHKKQGEAISGENNPSKRIDVRNKQSKSNKKFRKNNPNFQKGENHPRYGKHHTEAAKQKMRGSRPNVSGELNSNWNGGKDAEIRRRRGLGFIPINEKFPGSDAHHIDRDFIIYIPAKLHESLPHNAHTGQGMEEINNLAFAYTYREDRKLL